MRSCAPTPRGVHTEECRKYTEGRGTLRDAESKQKTRRQALTCALVLWAKSTRRDTLNTAWRQWWTTAGDGAAICCCNMVVILLVVLKQRITAEWLLALTALWLFIGVRRLFYDSSRLCCPDDRRPTRWSRSSGSWRHQFCHWYCLATSSCIHCRGCGVGSLTVYCFCCGSWRSGCWNNSCNISDVRRHISCIPWYLCWCCK